jgi:hypothetical protein
MANPCKRPRFRLLRVRVRGDRVVAVGALRKGARKRVRAALRCGKARTVRRARRTGPRRWAVSLPLRGRCATAARARLRVAYPGGGRFATAARKRAVRLSR